MNTRFRAALAALGFATLFTASPLSVAEPGADSGIVTAVQGNISYTSGQDKAKPVISFMKVRAGDRLDVPQDGMVQIAYFQGGKQETWRGPAKVQLEATGGKADKDAPQPAIKQLPPVVVQNLAHSPSVIADIRNRTGMFVVRATPAPGKLKEITDTYAALRKDAEESDVTPELYLLAAYHDMKLYREFKPVLEDMLRRQPNNPEIKAIAEQYARLTEGISK